MQAKPFNLKFTPAYLVEGWSTEVIHGYCSPNLFEEGGNSNKVLFTTDKKNFSFKFLGDKHSSKGVFTDLSLAINAMENQKKSYIGYLKNEIVKKQKQLEELTHAS